MKKKLIFMAINMNVGGTEKALLNLISEIPEEEYEITILMLEKYGGFLDSIPEVVNLEYLKEYSQLKKLLNNPPKQIMKDYFKKGRLMKVLAHGFIHYLSKHFGERSLYFKFLLRRTAVLEKEYDVAVAYAGPMDFISYFVVNKIKAKKKIQWIHFDVSKIGFNRKFAAKYYKKFNSIFVVSREGATQLIKLLPSVKNKIEYFPNGLPSDLVKRSLEKGFEDDFKGLRILTVGRLSKEKGQDLIISVMVRLRDEGYNVRWYCLGEGSSRKEYEEQINKNKLSESFILLGSNTNPYPFIRQCDVYVQPSRHEGYCITLSEAKRLCKPIVTTDFTGAKEQIIHEETGLIVPVNEVHLYKAVKKLLDDHSLRQRFNFKLQQEKVENNEIGNIDNIMGL